ncbi:hypothetical protein HAX54_044750, partial [Datura stramonium]|nr:hypothetical protein [Datura stramonium]
AAFQPVVTKDKDQFLAFKARPSTSLKIRGRFHFLRRTCRVRAAACACLTESHAASAACVRLPAPALTESPAVSAACVRMPVPMLARMPVWGASHPTACTHARQPRAGQDLAPTACLARPNPRPRPAEFSTRLPSSCLASIIHLAKPFCTLPVHLAMPRHCSTCLIQPTPRPSKVNHANPLPPPCHPAEFKNQARNTIQPDPTHTLNPNRPSSLILRLILNPNLTSLGLKLCSAQLSI